MNLVKGLINDILVPETKLSSILKKAKLFASTLGNNEFKKWIHNELNGYKDEKSVPDYRRFSGENFGDFVGHFGAELKNAPISRLGLPEPVKEFARDLPVCHGVRSLESLIESDSNTFQLGWPAEFVAIASDKVFEDYCCVSAWKSLSRSQVDQILDTVRNRLLDFILELKEMYPEVEKSEEVISSIPEEKVTSVFSTYIIGNQNIVATGSQIDQNVRQQIEKNNLNALLDYIRQIGIPDDEVQDLRRAIELDGPRTEPNKFGSRVAEWAGKITKEVLEGTCKTVVSTASVLITEALFRYYGWK